MLIVYPAFRGKFALSLAGSIRRRHVQSPRQRQPCELDVIVHAELGFYLIVHVLNGLDAQMEPARDFGARSLEARE